MRRFLPQIPDWFEPRRAAQVTAYFALKSGGKINILKATKLVYLSDRLSMARRDHPITGDNFVSMPFGPVNTFTYSYMDGAAHSDSWAEFVAPRNGNILELSKRIDIGDLDELSRSDLKILEDTWEEFKEVDRFELAEWTHRYCPEWRDPGGSSIPIDFSTVFKNLSKESPAELADDIQAERELFIHLAGK